MSLNEETHYRILKLLQDQPDITQRQLAQELGVSLGKANYCLKALVGEGLVKAGDFRRNPSKRNYAYLLTHKGVEEKSKLAIRFLNRKIAEYNSLKQEIEELRNEADRLGLVNEAS
jgi:EPS-associated MarR family transcriptional regulator